MYSWADAYVPFWSLQLHFIIPIVAIFIATLSLARLPRKHDPREPPYVYTSIPFIGHIIGMIQYGAQYFEIVKYACFAQSIRRPL